LAARAKVVLLDEKHHFVDKHYFADGCFSEMPRCVPKYRSPHIHAFAITS
jgi:hypothetical protein